MHYEKTMMIRDIESLETRIDEINEDMKLILVWMRTGKALE